MITHEIQDAVDKRFNEWYYSFPNRLRRAIAFFAGFEITMSILNNPFRVGLSLGWLHGGFNGFFAIQHIRTEVPSETVFAIGAECGKFGLTLLNKAIVEHDIKCVKCFDLYIEANERYNEIMTDEVEKYLNKHRKGDEGNTQPVERPKVPPSDDGNAVTPRPGALGDWMGVNN